MDDRSLHSLREEPRPEFARALRQRLRDGEAPATAAARRLPLTPLFAAAAGIAVVASLILFPSVRASAQAFLDLFRVRQFTAVSFDPSRFERFRAENHDQVSLVFSKVETLEKPVAPSYFTDPAAAGAAVGFTVRVPGSLPAGLVADTLVVSGGGVARMTVDAKRLRDVMTALDIRDVTVPEDLDGKSVTVHAARMVSQSFRAGERRVELAQSPSPEVELPAGVDLKRLGAIGLRILGVSPGDARRLATAIDWRSTLVVPVPTDAGSFREVTVHGQKGLLITRTAKPAGGERRRLGAVVLWSEGGQVYALAGDLGREELLAMAESVH